MADCEQAGQSIDRQRFHLELMNLCYNEIGIGKEVNLMEIDPVCGMEVDPKTAEYKSVYQGKTYYFCAPGCKRDFDKDPQKYVKGGMQTDEHQHMHGNSA